MKFDWRFGTFFPTHGSRLGAGDGEPVMSTSVFFPCPGLLFSSGSFLSEQVLSE